MRKTSVLFALVLALAAGCKDQPKTVETEIVRIRGMNFSPRQPISGEDLRLVIDYESPNNTKPGFSYRWYVNGELAQEGKSALLPGAKIISGAEIYAEIRASDGVKQTDWIPTGRVKAKDPGVRITRLEIEPDPPNRDQTLSAVMECEQCEGIKMYYRWRVNNAILEDQEEPELNGSDAGLKPGDQVMLEVSPEPEHPEIWYNSLPVKVNNRVPEFSGQGKIWLEGNQLYIKVSAEDPDGGAVSYQLREAPAGARMDSTGLVKWTVPPGFQGEAKFKVQARDPNGGVNELSESIRLSERETPAQ